MLVKALPYALHRFNLTPLRKQSDASFLFKIKMRLVPKYINDELTIFRIVGPYSSFPLALFNFPEGTLFNRARRESILKIKS
jgi:hypothetical protein